MSGRSEAVVRSLGNLFSQGTHCGLSDTELLERFFSRSDEGAAQAFEGLVLRHGPMVFDVCNKVLGNVHDAQDAFQATFLVLATRARSIRRQKSVGSWLHGVALRVARRARSDAVRRKAHERRIAEMTSHEIALEAPWDDRDFQVLHEEVERLPLKYREPVVLCYLEGMTLEMAAGQLGCPPSTLGVRLMRARERLKDRLGRRGVSRADGLLIAGPAAGPGSAVLPSSLVGSTVGAAIQVASGGAVTIAAAQLTNRVLRSMAMMRLTQVVAGIVAAMVGVASLGAALGRPEQRAAGKPASRPAGQAPESWLGRKVVTKYPTPLREGEHIVDNDRDFRVYTVNRVDGDRVKLVAQSLSGWVRAADLVLLDQAIEFYTKEIRDNGRNIAARLKRAQVWEYQGDRAKGIAELTEAITIEPKSAMIYTTRGIMLRRENQLDKAIADLDQAIRLDAGSATAYQERGEIWIDKKECKKAIEDFTKVLHLDPRRVSAYEERGDAWYALDETDKAIADYSEAIRLDPKDARAYSDRGVAWSARNQFDRSLADLDEAIRLIPGDVISLDARGRVWLMKKDYNKAMADLTEAIRLGPKYPLSYYDRGWVRLSRKEFDQAIADLNECIRLDPEGLPAYEARGRAWYEKGVTRRPLRRSFAI